MDGNSKSKNEDNDNEKWANLKDSTYKEVNEYIDYAVSNEGNIKNIKTGKK